MATKPTSEKVTLTESVGFVHVWQIQNLPLVYYSEKLIQEQKTEMYTVHGQPTVICRWEVSLIKSGDNLSMKFKVADIDGELRDNIDGSVLVQSLKKDGSSYHNTQAKATIRNCSECVLSPVYHSSWENLVVAPNGTAIFRIEMKFEQKSPKTISLITYQFEFVNQNSQNKILDRLANLCLSEDDSDVKIVTKDNCEIPAHSWVLKLQNEVFSSMLNADLQEKETGIIKVKDLSGKTMKIILHYLYTGKILDSWCDPDVAVEFTYAAGKYQLGDVLKLLDGTLGLIENMELSACCIQLLSLTNKLGLKKAEARLLEYAKMKASSAKTTEEFFACIGSNQ